MCSITLYRANGACSLAPHILLHEVQLPFTGVRLAFGPDRRLQAADGSLSHAEYLQINPAGLVPALAIEHVEHVVVTEMPAILTCIADSAPKRSLLGATPMEHVRVHEWLAWLSGTLHGHGYGMLLRPMRFVDEDALELQEKVKTRGREVIEKCHERIEARIDGEYAVGDRLTVVDINLYVFWFWGKRNGLDMDQRYPRFRNVMVKVEKLDSVKRAMEEEKLPLQFA